MQNRSVCLARKWRENTRTFPSISCFFCFLFFQAAADKKTKADADKRAAERKALLELAEARQRKVEEEQAAQQAQSAQDQMAADMAVSLSKGLMLSPFRMR